ncbi:putative quinol monooxygenase [Ruegeria sp. Ofav3-42]|uniref:putative quinol monooxygenase n=1 Tax=Ruegeria sp. Ofav3-42 TaxID=2917759 RepID=UPI001EF5482C|nr:putative quinol monooxygenase [Ruegeria sp. Ofav3-42]MCG7519058.1 antibiotic biosynthesis monooxygenase [Ruegeria sp. Ofav3-42]
MSEIVIIAQVVPESGQSDLLRNAIEELASASREEAGNKGYDVFVSPDQTTEFLIHEIWVDAEAITNHGRMPHMARFKEIVKGKARVSVQKLAKI